MTGGSSYLAKLRTDREARRPQRGAVRISAPSSVLSVLIEQVTGLAATAAVSTRPAAALVVIEDWLTDATDALDTLARIGDVTLPAVTLDIESVSSGQWVADVADVLRLADEPLSKLAAIAVPKTATAEQKKHAGLRALAEIRPRTRTAVLRLEGVTLRDQERARLGSTLQRYRVERR